MKEEQPIDWKPIIAQQVHEMKDMLNEFEKSVLKMDEPMAYVRPVKSTIFQATMFLLEQQTQHKKQGDFIIKNLDKNETNN